MRKMHTIVVGSLALAAGLATSLIAGPLDPPAGAINPTYKTLNEVEPRTAINQANTPGDNDATPSIFRITQPGSYYLTANINAAEAKRIIEVAASNVTIDLNGFTINGNAVALAGVRVDGSAHRGLVVRNGSIQWCAAHAVYAEFTPATVIHDLLIRQCNEGVRVGNHSRISDVTIESSAGVGLYCNGGCSVERTMLAENGIGFSAIGWSTLRSVVARSNAGDGFTLLFGGTITECVASDNDGSGFWLQNGVNISGCHAVGNAAKGIFLNGKCLALNNSCTGNDVGIYASNAGNRIEANHVNDNTTAGISVAFDNNVIVRNTARGNGINYSISSGEYAQIITNPGAGFSTTNAWANLSY